MAHGHRLKKYWGTAIRFAVREAVLAVVLAPLALVGLLLFAVPYGVTSVLALRCPPCGRRRAPRSPTSGPIPGERDRVRPLAPPVAVWAAFWGRCADVAAAAGSRAVGRRWAWRCAGLVRQA